MQINETEMTAIADITPRKTYKELTAEGEWSVQVPPSDANMIEVLFRNDLMGTASFKAAVHSAILMTDVDEEGDYIAVFTVDGFVSIAFLTGPRALRFEDIDDLPVMKLVTVQKSGTRIVALSERDSIVDILFDAKTATYDKTPVIAHQVHLSPSGRWALATTPDEGVLIDFENGRTKTNIRSPDCTADYQIHWIDERRVMWISCYCAHITNAELGVIERRVHYDFQVPLTANQLLDPRGDPTIKGMCLRAHRPMTPTLEWGADGAMQTSTADGCVYWWDTRTGQITDFRDFSGTHEDGMTDIQVCDQWAVTKSASELHIHHRTLPGPVCVKEKSCDEFLLLPTTLVESKRECLRVSRLGADKQVTVPFTAVKTPFSRMEPIGGDKWVLMQSLTMADNSDGSVTVFDGCTIVRTIQTRKSYSYLSVRCPTPTTIQLFYQKALQLQEWDLETRTLKWERKLQTLNSKSQSSMISDDGREFAQLYYNTIRIHLIDTEFTTTFDIPLSQPQQFATIRCFDGDWLMYCNEEAGSVIYVVNVKRKFCHGLKGLRRKAVQVSTISISPRDQLVVAYKDGIVQVLEPHEWDPNARKAKEDRTCDVCGVEFVNTKYRNEHRKTCILRPTWKREALKTKKYQCIYCGKEDKHNIHRHMESCARKHGV